MLKDEEYHDKLVDLQESLGLGSPFEAAQEVLRYWDAFPKDFVNFCETFINE